MLSDIFAFIDRHELDKHVISTIVLYGTVKVTEWAMVFASSHPGEYAAIAAVTAPFCALQAAAIKFYFDNRTPPST